MTSAYSCPTVKIVTPIVAGNKLGFVEINESDFDDKKHNKFVEREKTKAELQAEVDEAAKAEAAETATKAENEAAEQEAVAKANSFAAGKAPPPSA